MRIRSAIREKELRKAIEYINKYHNNGNLIEHKWIYWLISFLIWIFIVYLVFKYL